MQQQRKRKQITLISVTPSSTEGKKWRARFQLNNNKRHVLTDFGSTRGKDYTMHKNDTRKNWYIMRHMKDLRTNDPTRAGYLSMFILYNKKDINRAIADYQKRLDAYNQGGDFPSAIKGYVNPANLYKKPRIRVVLE